MANHRDTHPQPVEGCYGCKIQTVVIGKGDLSPAVADTNRREDALTKDREAYKRLRRDGLQPDNVDGSAQLEARVIDQIELDYKRPIPAKDLPMIKDIQAQVNAATPQASW